MTEVCRRMLSDDEEDSPEKCRERRRRRIEMRRMAAISAAGSPPPMPSQNLRENPNRTDSSGCSAEASKRIRTEEKIDFSAAASSSSSGDDVGTSSPPEREGLEAREPVFGTMSVAGRSRQMEDAIAVHTSLHRPEITRRRPVHFFAVFDGHGGPHVSARSSSSSQNFQNSIPQKKKTVKRQLKA